MHGAKIMRAITCMSFLIVLFVEKEILYISFIYAFGNMIRGGIIVKRFN